MAKFRTPMMCRPSAGALAALSLILLLAMPLRPATADPTPPARAVAGNYPAGPKDTGGHSSATAAGKTIRDCPECPELVIIPAGRFTMGSAPDEPGRQKSEDPPRAVTIPQPLAIGKHEVSFAGWDACVKAGACKHRPDDEGWGGGSRPVINVSWSDAKSYTTWLSAKTGATYRLPSEAEWEYAARAGSTTRFPWGSEPGSTRANFHGSGSQWSGKQTAPAGQFAANAFGLHDVIGNVWEWTEDCWNATYAGAPVDGAAWRSGDCDRRVRRGGSWYSLQDGARSATRTGEAVSVRDRNIGFRVVRTLGAR